MGRSYVMTTLAFLGTRLTGCQTTGELTSEQKGCGDS